MSTFIIDGKQLSSTLLSSISNRADTVEQQRGHVPTLVLIQVGSDSYSSKYLVSKARKAKACGCQSIDVKLNEKCSQIELSEAIVGAAQNPLVDGILLQLPLPDHLNPRDSLKLIPAEKDVDGLSLASLGLLAAGEPFLEPCTPKAVLAMIAHAQKETGKPIGLEGTTSVIIGRSNLVGATLGRLMTLASSTVTICHSKTKDLQRHTSDADIVVSAVGSAHLLTGSMIQEGSIIIDVGLDYSQGKVKGDFDTDSCLGIASAISPVPGGVGPMTIAMLLENLVLAAEAK